MQSTTLIINQKGFTLIEAIVSILFISFGLMAITQMQITSIRGNTSAMNTLKASIESNTNSEMLMSNTFTPTADGTTAPIPSADGRYNTTYTYTNANLFKGRNIVNGVTLNVFEQYQIIDITTTWLEAGRTKTLQTISTKYLNEGL